MGLLKKRRKEKKNIKHVIHGMKVNMIQMQIINKTIFNLVIFVFYLSNVNIDINLHVERQSLFFIKNIFLSFPFFTTHFCYVYI